MRLSIILFSRARWSILSAKWQTFTVDEPENAGGTDTGPQPTDYFLGSLASCFLLALAYAARKRSIELAPDLTVEVLGTYEGPRFADLRIVVGGSTPAEVLEPLLPAAQRVCYVSNTLRRPPPITVETALPDPG